MRTFNHILRKLYILFLYTLCTIWYICFVRFWLPYITLLYKNTHIIRSMIRNRYCKIPNSKRITQYKYEMFAFKYKTQSFLYLLKLLLFVQGQRQQNCKTDSAKKNSKLHISLIFVMFSNTKFHIYVYLSTIYSI